MRIPLATVIKIVIPLIIVFIIYLIPFYLLTTTFSASPPYIYNSTKSISVFSSESYLSVFQGLLTFGVTIFGFYSLMLVFILDKVVKRVARKISSWAKEVNVDPTIELIQRICMAGLIILVLMFPLLFLLESIGSALSGMGTYGFVYGQLYSVNSTTHQLVVSNIYQPILSDDKSLLSYDISSSVYSAFNAAYLIFIYIFLYIYFTTLFEET